MSPETVATVATVAKALYLEWGIIHIFAGVKSLYNLQKGDIASYLTGICANAPAAAKDDARSQKSWNPMNKRILLQHGWNLIMVGLWSCAVAYVVKNNRYLWFCGLWALSFDVGYFIAVDIPKYGSLFGELQTIFISIAQICASLLVTEKYADVDDLEASITLYAPAIFIAVTVLNKLFGKGHPAVKAD